VAEPNKPALDSSDLVNAVFADDTKNANLNLARMSKIQKALFNRTSILRPDQQNKLTEGERKADILQK
jgi:hypothetical protein